MNDEEWRSHIQRRSDFATRVTHLTKRQGETSAFDILIKILNEKRLLASGKEGYISGDKKCVCFQELPLHSLAENILYEFDSANKNGQGKTPRYEAYGIRINKRDLFERGGRPVIYGTREEMSALLKPDDYWRYVRMELANEELIDWSHEREWRILGDFEFEYNRIEVILGDNLSYQRFIEYYQQNNPQLLKEINGIIVLQSVLN